jgi:hypothetical protein
MGTRFELTGVEQGQGFVKIENFSHYLVFGMLYMLFIVHLPSVMDTNTRRK